MEPLTNIGYLCPECGDERHKAWQEKNKDFKIRVNDWCKIAFKEEEQTEHMFVKVRKIETIPDKETVYEGDLDNDPLHLKNIKYGDKVRFGFNQIEQVYRREVMI